MPNIIELAGDDFDSPQAKAHLFDETANVGEVPIELVDPDEASAFDTDNDRVEEVVDATGTLINTRDNISKMDVDDTSSTAYNALRSATEHLMHVIEPCKAYYPVMEAMAGRQKKKVTIQHCLEALSDLIIAGVKHILEWVRKAATYVRNLFQKARTSSGGLATRAKRIQADAKDTIIKKLSADAAVTRSDLIAFFNKAGTPITSDQIGAEYKRYINEIGGNFSTELVKKSGDQVLAVIPTLEKLIDKAEVLGKIDPIITTFRNDLLKHFKEGFDDKKSDEHQHLISYALPFNNESLVCSIAIEEGKQTSIKMMGHEERVQSNAKQIDVLNASEVGMLAKIVEEQATYGIYKQHDSIVAEVNKIENAINQATNKVIKAISAKPDDAKKDMYSLEFLRSIFAALTKYVDLFYKYDVKVAVKILDYCEASLLQYE